MAITTTLSTIQPDASSIVTQLQADLEVKDAWKDLVRSSTGQTLIEFIANVGALDQYTIEQAYKQCFLETSLTDSAVLSIARMLGVRVSRKLPASITVSLTRDSTLALFSIPIYSQFSCGNFQLFNRAAIVFPIGTATVNVTLYEGEIRSFTQTSSGSDFEMFKAVEDAFQVSDTDVYLTVNGVVIDVKTTGLWNLKNTAAVTDVTTKDGEMMLLFGNVNYGFKSQISDTISITYAVTQGAAALDSSLTGTTVSYLNSSSVEGLATSGLSGGGDPLNINSLKKISPFLYSANDRATTKNEMSAVANQYPGVYDALVIGQREIAPTDVRYMNLSQVTLLTDTVYTNPQWNDFLAWYKQRTIYPVEFFRVDPVQFPINISANIYCLNTADLSNVQFLIQTKLTSFLAKRKGILGFNVYRSDIYKVIEESDPSIQYIELLTPTIDSLLYPNAPKNLTLTELVTAGTMGGVDLIYGVTVVTAVGESIVTNFTPIRISASNKAVRLDWTGVPQATNYKIYGRLATGYIGLIATVSAATLTYTDDGSIAPTTTLPTINASGIYYPSLGTTGLNMFYGQRTIQTNAL